MPPPPEMVTSGAEVYPLPFFVTLIIVTILFDTVAVAVAPVPPPPEMFTVGVKPHMPPAFILILLTAPRLPTFQE